MNDSLLSKLNTLTKQLSESEERMRMLTRAIPVGLIIITEQAKIEAVNPATELMFGYAAAALSGRSIVELFADTQDDQGPMLLETLHAQPVTLRGKTASGKLFPLDVSAQRFVSGHGNRLLLVAIDVSEREELERLKREFVAITSHELRTPLNSIHAFLSMLSDGMYGDVPELVLQRAGGAANQASRLMDLINDLLDLEKIRAGKFEFVFASVELSSILETAAAAVSTALERQHITLSVDRSNVVISVDQARIAQVLINLLSNAIKFSKAGDTISMVVQDQGALVEIKVIDQGPGVPKSEQQLIFERFYQTQEGALSGRSGTGLGLAICKTIVQEHGGTIGVESEPGQGCTFWLRLPKSMRGL